MISGVCTAIAVGYFVMAHYPQAIADLCMGGNKGSADEPSSDRASIPSGSSGSVSTEIQRSGAEDQQQVTVIADNHREPSTADDASQNVHNQIENRPISDCDLQSANHPSSNPVTDSPASETFPEPTDSELSARGLAATSPDENLAMAYSSDLYGLLPPRLTESGFEMRRKLHPGLADESKSVLQNQESPILDRGPNAQEASTAAVSDPKRATSEIAEPARERDPEHVLPPSEVPATAPAPGQIPDPTGTRASAAAVASALASTKAPAENSKPTEIAVVSAPALAEPTPQQPKTVDPASPSTARPPPLASENDAAAPPPPKNSSPAFAGTQAPAEDSRPEDTTVLSAPELAEPTPQQPKTVDPVSPSTPKPPALANENNAAASPAPENGAPALAGTKAPAENSKPADIAVVSAPELAEPLPQQPKTADPRVARYAEAGGARE